MKLFISLLVTALFGLSNTLNAQAKEQLVLFIQDGRSISQDFKRNALPEIKKIARHNNLKLNIVDASNGAPQEVTYTPAIFYQKGEDKILFDGRYSDFANLIAFVKSQGKKQPTAMTKPSSNSLTWNIGRATLKTTMTIHPLSGKPPRAKKFDASQFEKEAMAALVNGMDYFRQAHAGIDGDAKSYHMDFYPEVNMKEGVILIQMKLYSEFDPQTPVFETEIPTGSFWKEWEVAFEKAGNRLEKALIAQISNWDNGDGFDTLKAPVESWGASLKMGSLPPSQFTQKGGDILASERD